MTTQEIYQLPEIQKLISNYNKINSNPNTIYNYQILNITLNKNNQLIVTLQYTSHLQKSINTQSVTNSRSIILTSHTRTTKIIYNKTTKSWTAFNNPSRNPNKLSFYS